MMSWSRYAPLLLTLCAPSPARASCAPRSMLDHLKDAQQVFLGRAGKKVVRGDHSVQPFTVLHPIKGKLGPVFERVLRATPPNHREFAPGEVAVVFVHSGVVDLCAGNLPLEAQLVDLPLLLGGGEKHAPVLPVEREALEAALDAALRGYVHGRRTIVVGYAPRAAEKGRPLQAHGATLRIQPSAPPEEVEITRARVAGAVRLVSGRYGKEGLAFDVLLLRRTGPGGKVDFDALHVSRRERAGR